jgi:hypothetical protein
MHIYVCIPDAAVAWLLSAGSPTDPMLFASSGEGLITPHKDRYVYSVCVCVCVCVCVKDGVCVCV